MSYQIVRSLGFSNSEVYSELYQISKMRHFAKIVNGLKPLKIFAKRSILDIDRVLNVSVKVTITLVV